MLRQVTMAWSNIKNNGSKGLPSSDNWQTSPKFLCTGESKISTKMYLQIFPLHIIKNFNSFCASHEANFDKVRGILVLRMLLKTCLKSSWNCKHIFILVHSLCSSSTQFFFKFSMNTIHVLQEQ